MLLKKREKHYKSACEIVSLSTANASSTMGDHHSIWFSKKKKKQYL
jgi:hypothetical protein